jgi:two-component system, OmpR family, response regulator TctD
MKLLLVEDDFDLCGALTRALQRRGFDVSSTGDGLEAIRLARTGGFDVMLLDLSLPGLDGLQVLQRLRGGGDTLPILVLTARGTVGDRVAGLNAGADDYLAKPFDLDELEARIRALVRRTQSDTSQRCAKLSFEPGSGAFYCQGKPLELTPREHALLKSLIHKPGHAVAKERLLALVFSDEPATQADAVEVVVHRLRKKLLPTGAEIMTLRGLGYALVERDSA